MKPSVALKWVLRESRGARGRMLYFVACLAVGVAAVVGTAGIAESVAQGFREHSREILGADLSVSAHRPLPADLGAAFSPWPGTERADLTETASMIAAPGAAGGATRSQLAQVHAVTGRYPLFGELTTDPPGGLGVHLAADSVVVAPELLESLGLVRGDDLLVGGTRFRVAATVVRAPPRFGFASFLGPPVYVSADGLARTRLLGFGTRVRHRALFALPAGSTREDLDAAVVRIGAVPGAQYLDVDLHHQVGPGGGQTTSRLEGFLGLVALLSLVVGGIGVAQIARTWIAGRTQAIAVMRCLGLRPAEILAISLGHLGLLAVAGSVVGTAIGCAMPPIAAWIAPDLAPGGMPAVFPVWAAVRGLVLGLGIALVFSLPPLTAVWRVSPALVLRADAAPLPAPRGVLIASIALVVATVLAAAWLQARQPAWALWFTAGFAALAALLWGASRVLVWGAARLPRRRLNAYVAHGIAALARPGAGTTAAVVSLGLGAMVVVSMGLVESRLRHGLLDLAPPGAPSVFLIDVQPGQWTGVDEALRDAGATNVDRVPVVTARIAAIDGRPVEEFAETGGAAAPGERGQGRSRRSLTREQRLTSREALTSDNRVVEGALWSDPARAEVSIEQRFAVQLGVKVGSTITFDIQGVPLELAVTSLRSVQWQSLSINFFFLVEPGALGDAPGLVLASARVPPESERALRDRVTRDYPNVTVLQLGPVIAEVAALIGRVAAGVSALGTFCVVAGLLVLAGSASATMLRRRREIALLKTLGVTRGGVTALLAVEYGLAGAVAGFVGAGGALLLSWGFLTYVTEIDVDVPLVVLPLTALACAVATAASGLAAGARTLAVRPIESLRGRSS